MPKFSILLPTHNRADVIGFAIESALNQTEPDFELLIVGDGCTDNTSEVVQAFADERIKWFDLPKAKGFGYANRNTVLKQAQGEYIAFLGHDNLYLPDHLSLMGNLLDGTLAEFAFSRPIWIDRNGQIYPGVGSLHHASTRQAFFDQGNFLPASPIVYRRTCHEKYGLWNEDLPRGGDWELWIRYVKRDGSNYAYLPISTTLHFQANWRTSKNYGSGRLSVMPHLFEDESMNPITFQIRIPDGKLEQEVFWALIQENPQWIQHLRQDVDALVERLSELYLYESLSFIHEHRTAWRMMQILFGSGWLRKLRRTVAPPGTRREHWWLRLKGDANAYEQNKES